MRGPLRSVGVVGVGHIGGSLARALATRVELAVADVDEEAEAALARATGARRGLGPVAASELVVVATPTPAVPSILEALAARGARGLVVDVASVKRGLPEPQSVGVRWLSLHPMAGREGSGWRAADPAIFPRATWAFVLDGSERADDVALALEFVFGLLGAGAVVALGRAEHDAILALVSHLPHLLAEALGLVLARSDAAPRWWLGSGSLRDATRVACSDPRRVAEMVVPNVEELCDALGALEGALAELRRHLGDPEVLVRRFEEARRAARRLRREVGSATAFDAPELAATLRALSDAGEAVVGFEPPSTLYVASQ